MPTYPYKCLACGAPDLRVAGIDDETAVCHLCDGLMLRQSQDPYQHSSSGPVNKDHISTDG